MLSCNCLNILIDVVAGDTWGSASEQPPIALTSAERHDFFFQPDTFEVVATRKITLKIPWLVEMREIGSWIVHKCTNCDLNTHATNKEKSNNLVVVNAKLLQEAPTVESLEQNEFYSKVFQIIVSCEDEANKSDDNHSNAENRSPELQVALDEFRKKLDEAVHREVVQTEQRVRNYTEKQYSLLERFKEKANKDCTALMRLMLKKRVHPSFKPFNQHFVDRSVPEHSLSPVKTPQNKHILTQIRNNSNRSFKKQMSQPAPKNSLDSEGLFSLEDMDDGNGPFSNDDDSTDTEEAIKTEAAYAQRQQKVAMSVAKSLPMNIPGFMSRFQEMDDEPSEFVVHEEHPSNIAAEIKALAKSVHGDAVFGDLPRPRFSSQI